LSGAEQEVSIILGSLGRPRNELYKRPILDKVFAIRSSFHQKSKYCKIKKLVPLVIYTFLALQGFRVNISDILRFSGISYEELKWFFYQIKRHLITKYGNSG
jgi:hypothetical protein